MTLGQALREAVSSLDANQVGSPRLNAETLLMFVLDCDRAYLFAHPERELTPEEYRRYQAVLAKRIDGIPTQYITGHQEFWGLDLIVSPAVLIPRPETEHSIEVMLELTRGSAAPRIIDVGTGSGCIALALAKELPTARIEAVDISPEALEVARANAVRLEFADRVKFSQSDLLTNVDAGDGFDFIVSNPPYVGEDEPEKVQKQVRDHEPKVAVFSGPSGLEAYERLIPQAHAALKAAGWLVLEIGYSIEEPVRKLLDGWSEVRVTPDLQGIPRVVAARK